MTEHTTSYCAAAAPTSMNRSLTLEWIHQL